MIILSNHEHHYIGQPFVPNIRTIAFALSNINRFTGHVGQYSVAQHCVLVAEQLPDELKLSALLHDAPEAYIGDVAAPLKRFLPDYQKLEDFYHNVIDSTFAVDTRHPEVKMADVRMLVTEAKCFGFDLTEFPKYEPYDALVVPWTPFQAATRYMNLFLELTGE